MYKNFTDSLGPQSQSSLDKKSLFESFGSLKYNEIVQNKEEPQSISLFDPKYFNQRQEAAPQNEVVFEKQIPRNKILSKFYVSDLRQEEPSSREQSPQTFDSSRE